MATDDRAYDTLENTNPSPNSMSPEGVDFVSLVTKMCVPFSAGQNSFNRLVLTSSNPRFVIAVHPKGELISDAIVDSGTWDHEHATMLVDLIRPHGDIVLDVGANIGSLGLFWAATGLDVHAFEPMLANFELLQCSAKLNGLYNTRLTPHFLAFGNESTGTVCMSPITGNMGASEALSAQTEGCLSPTSQTTLDTFVTDREKYFSRQFALLKIDVEGFEPMVLQGAQRVLASKDLRPKVLTLEMAAFRWRNIGWSAIDVLGLITKHGYQIIHPETAKTDLTKFLQETSEGNPDITFMHG